MYEYVHKVNPEHWPETWESIIEKEPEYYETAMNAAEHAVGVVLATVREAFGD